MYVGATLGTGQGRPQSRAHIEVLFFSYLRLAFSSLPCIQLQKDLQACDTRLSTRPNHAPFFSYCLLPFYITSAIRNACLPREDTDTQPVTRCRAGIGDSSLTFWRFAIAGVGGIHFLYSSRLTLTLSNNAYQHNTGTMRQQYAPSLPHFSFPFMCPFIHHHRHPRGRRYYTN